MFGFNAGITRKLTCFAEFNSLRKNQLLAFYSELPQLARGRLSVNTKHRDYYFMAQFEIGQRELRDLHEYTYELDMLALQAKGAKAEQKVMDRIQAVNEASSLPHLTTPHHATPNTPLCYTV